MEARDKERFKWKLKQLLEEYNASIRIRKEDNKSHIHLVENGSEDIILNVEGFSIFHIDID